MLSITSKLYANTLDINNRQSKSILEKDRRGFRRGRDTMDAILTVQQILKKGTDFNISTLVLFVDYEKEYSSFNRENVWQILRDEWHANATPNSTKRIISKFKHKYKEYYGKISEPNNANKGARQERALSQDLTNVRTIETNHLNWHQVDFPEIIQATINADDQVILRM